MEQHELDKLVAESNRKHREKIANDHGFKSGKEHDKYLNKRDKEDFHEKMLHTLRNEGIKEHEHPYWEGAE